MSGPLQPPPLDAVGCDAVGCDAVGCDAVDFDPASFDPVTAAYTVAPQRWFPAIHARSPVFLSGRYDAWMIFDYAVGKTVLSDLRFSRDRSNWERPGEQRAVERWPLTEVLRRESPFVNQAKHRANRAMYSGAFKPSAIRRMEHIILGVIEEYCAPLRSAREVDLVALLASIPNTVISRVVGIAPEAQAEARFKDAASQFLLASSPFGSDANRDLAEQGTGYLFDAIGELVERRRRQPADDLVSGLLEGAGDRPDVGRDIVLSVASLISAGTDTTRHSAALALRTLLRRRDVLAQLRRDRQLLDAAVLELLRYEFPAKFLVRFATEDVRIGDHLFEQGKMVLTTLHGCGWDPQVFDDPARIDLGRDQRRYPVFGHGEFYCLGAHLAKFQLKHIIAYFLDHLPDTALFDEQRVEWEAPDMVLRGLASMPLTLR